MFLQKTIRLENNPRLLWLYLKDRLDFVGRSDAENRCVKAKLTPFITEPDRSHAFVNDGLRSNARLRGNVGICIGVEFVVIRETQLCCCEPRTTGNLG
ncbi:hypothetical protein M0804_000069 [Polistes exclamans]|nr:hypothetical protein M0804_000069 [Polistes exclamans]